jgi:hypothetical protein
MKLIPESRSVYVLTMHTTREYILDRLMLINTSGVTRVLASVFLDWGVLLLMAGHCITSQIRTE